MNSAIWVYVENHGGKPAKVSLELIGKARTMADRIGWKVVAVLCGHDVAAVAGEILNYGVDEVLVADDPLLGDFCSRSYAKVLADAVKQYRPEVFLVGGTALGSDLGPRLAARLRTGLSAHCIDLELSEQGELLAVVPGWGGNAKAGIRCPEARPQMATVGPGVFDVPQPGTRRGEIARLETAPASGNFSYRVVETVREEPKQEEFDTARVIVAGGYGIGSAENWKLVQDLADALGGAVGATRPPVDEGWADEHRMIGTSGRTVRPKLYVGVAVSGHLHHLVGIRKPDFMVGINRDPKAPLFEHCDLGLVGDYREIIPALLKALASYSAEE